MRLRRIARFRYNNLPMDTEGRYFYINDGKDIWNRDEAKTELDFYECRHGLGIPNYGEKNGISVKQISLVPLKYNGEVHRLTSTNKTSETEYKAIFIH